MYKNLQNIKNFEKFTFQANFSTFMRLQSSALTTISSLSGVHHKNQRFLGCQKSFDFCASEKINFAKKLIFSALFLTFNTYKINKYTYKI